MAGSVFELLTLEARETVRVGGDDDDECVELKVMRANGLID
jgi:hypothetical protein